MIQPHNGRRSIIELQTNVHCDLLRKTQMALIQYKRKLQINRLLIAHCSVC